MLFYFRRHLEASSDLLNGGYIIRKPCKSAVRREASTGPTVVLGSVALPVGHTAEQGTLHRALTTRPDPFLFFSLLRLSKCHRKPNYVSKTQVASRSFGICSLCCHKELKIPWRVMFLCEHRYQLWSDQVLNFRMDNREAGSPSPLRTMCFSSKG